MQLGLLGAGLQGQACVFDWLRQSDVRGIRVLDASEEQLALFRERFVDERLSFRRVDAGDHEKLRESIAGCDALLSAVPYFLNLAVTRAAIEARVPMVDLGGNTDVVFQQRALDPEARAAGVGIIPDQGLAPGLAGILGLYGMRDFTDVASIRMYVGGLPQQPRGPLSYALVFSVHGLLNEYAGEAVGLQDGEIVRAETLTGLETIRFPHPVGRCEAAYTSGGTSTLPWTCRGRVRELFYKTVRYPGHWSCVRFLKELGFLETQPRAVGRQKVAPRDFLGALLEPQLTFENTRDLVVLRVRVRGTMDGRPALRQYEMIDFHNEAEGLTAMMRTTAFPASEAALRLARGQVRQAGVLAGESVLADRAYFDSLRGRGLRMREMESFER